MERGKNIFDKIGSLIPGYAGYAERDGRRQCDKLLREKVVVVLDSSEKVLAQKIATEIKTQNFDKITDFEECRKRLNTLSSKIKFAAYGESAFFSSNQLKEDELMYIYQRDYALLEKANEFNHAISNLDIPSIISRIDEVNTMLNDRNEYIKEFK